MKRSDQTLILSFLQRCVDESAKLDHATAATLGQAVSLRQEMSGLANEAAALCAKVDLILAKKGLA